MREPRTSVGRDGLRALLADPRGAVVALDYDGTLAPIVDRAEDALPHPEAARTMTGLSARVGQVAVITGRPAPIVVEVLRDVPGLTVLGQYGVQRWADGKLTEEPPVPGLARARAGLHALTPDEQGVTVEDKGHSLVVHTRQADAPAEALARLQPRVAELAAAAGLELHQGRMVLELRPPGHDKGRALRSLADGASAVLFAGDDLGDLSAFDEVDRRRGEGAEGLLVCSDSDEAPQELRERADLVVPGPSGVVHLLAELAAELG